MHRLLHILLFLFVFRGAASDSVNTYGPTAREIARAQYFQKPLPGWGYQARQEKNLRLILVGGSNTASHYANYLTSVLQNTTLHPYYTAKVTNAAISGCNPVTYIGMRYSFEDDPPEKWPNVVLLEFTVNYYHEYSVSEDVDALIQTMRFRYKQKQLPDPDFMFLELFSMEWHLKAYMGHGYDKLASLSNTTIPPMRDERTNGHFRGCPRCKDFREVATFYGYPTISYRDMMFPAFVRYYLNTNGTFNDNPWVFTYEGSHLRPVATQLLVDQLMVPFFNEVMTPREELPEVERTMYGGVNVRMYPAALRNMQLLSLSTLTLYDTKSSSQKLLKAAKKSSGYTLNARKEVRGRLFGNECYGSNNQSAVLNVDLTVPSECSSFGNCKVSMEFIHSWNISHFGPAHCELRQRNAKVILESMQINVTKSSSGAVMKHTAPMTSQFRSVLKPGKYSVGCSKSDDRLTCFSGVSIAASVLI